MNRRTFLRSALPGGLLAAAASHGQSPTRRPNIVVILADDLGYGDLSCYGSRTSTPALDRMASEGARFTSYYSASAVCTPARAALMTGRYPARSGMVQVLWDNATTGLPDTEVTVPQMLRQAGYRTMAAGKWHLGSLPQFLPTNRGFDSFYGIPYSHDMAPLPLLWGTETLEANPRLDTLNERFTRESVRFIGENRDNPFFLFLGHTAPHLPLFPSPAFRRKSKRGLYADLLQEMDSHVGSILEAIRSNGLDDNTIVMFMSDNGPWFQGSTAGMRGRKDESFEGGMRVPMIARMPGSIPAGAVVNDIATSMDILPTAARLAGIERPRVALDGIDIWPLLCGEVTELPREPFVYFNSWHMQCARLGRWKLHVSRYNTKPWTPYTPGGGINLPLFEPELYDVAEDPQESYECSADNMQVVADIRARMEAMLPTMPEKVNLAWRDTMRRKVNPTPAGALPESTP